MKKFLGIIVLVAVIGFSFVACNNGSGSSSGTGGGGETIKYVANYSPEYDFYTDANFPGISATFVSIGGLGGVNPGNASEVAQFKKLNLTLDDIVFTPNDVLKKESLIRRNSEDVLDLMRGWVVINVTKLKSGDVTVTIKDKGGYSFSPYNNNDKIITVP